MNIVTLSPLYPNPTEPNLGIFVHRRVRAVARLHQVQVIASVRWFTPNENHARQMPHCGEYDGVPVLYQRYFRVPRLFRAWHVQHYYNTVVPVLNRIRRGFPFQILDVHWIFPETCAAVRYAKTCGVKVVATVRGNEAIGYFGSPRLRHDAREALQQVDHIISISRDLAGKMEREYGIPAAKITVIPNGIDPGQFHSIDPACARRELQWPEGPQRIVAVSRLSPEKGIDHLIRAVQQMKSPVEIHIIGDGPQRRKLRRLAGNNDRIKFLGELPATAISAYLNAADLLCCPSLGEGCPNAVVEALACGVPVVASNVGGIPDLVRNRELGRLVEPANPAALAQALDESLITPWNREAIARASQRTWDDVAREVDEVFRKVAG